MAEEVNLCPEVERTFELVGKRWTGLIIYVLLSGPKRFSQINALIPDLSKRMLTERMKELEENGIVNRNVIPERPVKIEYVLTQKGTELGNILRPIKNWADNWMKEEK